MNDNKSTPPYVQSLFDMMAAMNRASQAAMNVEKATELRAANQRRKSC